MFRRVTPSSAHTLRLMRHLADVAVLKCDPPAQRQLLIEGLNRLIGTHSAFFYVADEWRLGKRPHFTHATLTRQHDVAFVRYTSEFGIKFPLEDDPYCYHSIRSPATNQLWTSVDVHPDRRSQFRHPNYMDLRSTTRLRDGVVSFFRTGAGGDRIIGVGMHRFGAETRLLTARQRSLVRLAVMEIRSLIERGHLIVPAVNDEAVGTGVETLPPRLKQILERILSGRAPKSIARELGLSVWTVREHMQRLYKRFDVSGREELTARFVTEGQGRPFD